MRVLYFSQDFTAHDQRFLKSLAETEHEIFHLQLKPTRTVPPRLEYPEDVELVDWIIPKWVSHPLMYPLIMGGFQDRINEIQPDVIHAGPIQRPAFLAALAGFHPLVAMSWGSDLLMEAREGIGRGLAKYTLNRSSICLCDCEAVRDAALGLDMPADRIVVFPWGVDLEFFHPSGPVADIRNELGWLDKLVFISTRAWEPIYGVTDIVEAFNAAVRENDDIRLLLMNDGSERRMILPTIEEANIRDKVHLSGWVPESELPRWFRTADIYLSASYSDGSSISLLQAMACGRPALVSDIPGNLEWIDPRFNGWTFPVGDVQALSAQMMQFAQEPSLKESFGAKSRAIVESRASWERNFNILLEVYQLARSMEVTA